MSPCARACWRAVSQLLCVPCSSPPPPVKTQNLCHDTTHVACCVERVAALVATFLCYVAGRCIAAPGTLCRDTRPAPPVTIQPFVSRHTPTAKPCVRATAHPARRLTVSQGLLVVSWGRVIGLLAVSWPPTARPYAPVS